MSNLLLGTFEDWKSVFTLLSAPLGTSFLSILLTRKLSTICSTGLSNINTDTVSWFLENILRSFFLISRSVKCIKVLIFKRSFYLVTRKHKNWQFVFIDFPNVKCIKWTTFHTVDSAIYSVRGVRKNKVTRYMAIDAWNCTRRPRRFSIGGG